MKFLVSKFPAEFFHLAHAAHHFLFSGQMNSLVSEPPIFIPNLFTFQMRLICHVLMYNFLNFFFCNTGSFRYVSFLYFIYLNICQCQVLACQTAGNGSAKLLCIEISILKIAQSWVFFMREHSCLSHRKIMPSKIYFLQKIHMYRFLALLIKFEKFQKM